MNLYPLLGEPHHRPIGLTVALELADQCSFGLLYGWREVAALVMKTQGQMGGCEDLDRMLAELETMSEDAARQLLAGNSAVTSR
jgi:hypothetical protein